MKTLMFGVIVVFLACTLVVLVEVNRKIDVMLCSNVEFKTEMIKLYYSRQRHKWR